MKLLITGASGYLGRRLAERAAPRHTVFSGYAGHRERIGAGEPVHLDLRQPEDARATIVELRPDAVVHTAAVNPGGPQDDMMAVNACGTRVVAEAARQLGARLVHVSSDVVHDGRQAPYADDATPTPLGLYPESKVAGEEAVRETMPSAAIVRTSLIYGLEEMDAGTRSFVERLRSGETVKLFGDVLRQPVWVETLAEALLRLAETEYSGFLNVAGSQALDRDAFGRKMLAYWGFGNEEGVERVSARQLGLVIPYDLRFQLDRARDVLEMALPGVDEVLAAGSPASD